MYSSIFVTPWGLIGAVANVAPMIVGGLIAFEVCKFLPWMAKQESDPEEPAAAQEEEAAPAAEAPVMNSSWFVKRVFADFTEANFYGSEIAGFLLSWGTYHNISQPTQSRVRKR